MRRAETGRALLELTGAYPEELVSDLARAGIWFRSMDRIDPVTLRLVIRARDLERVRGIARRRMIEVRVLKRWGVVHGAMMMSWRICYPALLLGLMILVFRLQGHILFLDVSGNQTIPGEQILRVLEDQGVGFWTRADGLDMNRIKNETLTAMPELGWITINLEGSRARVIVREREEKPAVARDAAPASIVAKKAGLIEDLEAESGTPMVKRGDVVQAGQVLISGVTDLERTVLLTRAEGAVYARTWNTMAAVLPENAMEKRYTGREKTRWSLTVGKNTINFCKTSGISYEGYDKIISTNILTLPGGYAFPVAVTKTVLREYQLTPRQEPDPESLLEQAALYQMQSVLRAGTILKSSLDCERSGHGWRLQGTAECREEIGSIVRIME